MSFNLAKSCLVMIACSAVVSHQNDADTTHPWDKAMSEVTATLSPPSLHDSVAKAFEIGPQERLRKSPTGQLRFNRHEQLVYDAGWAFIRGGYAVVDVDKDSATNRLTITAKAVSNNLATAFFRVRDLVRTDCDLEGFYPYFFEQHLREKGMTDRQEYIADTWTMYDHVKQKAYTNSKHDSLVTAITPCTQNYISMLFYVRTILCQPGDTFSVHCFVHGKDYPIHFDCMARESVTVDAGKFDCVKIQPKMVGNGHGFTSKDKIYIWLTNDEYRVPIKLQAQEPAGHWA